MTDWLAMLDRLDEEDATTADHSGNFGNSVTGSATGRSDLRKRSFAPSWDDADAVCHWYEERAAIIEEGCGCTRPEAEARAYDGLVAEWLNSQAPRQTNSEVCVHCSAQLGARDSIAVLDGRGGHYRLHDSCWDEWSLQLREDADRALSEYGIKQGNGA